MIINSYNIEFGYELIAVIPYAYYWYKQKQLKRTISGKDTSCLYYFSPDHVENPERRSWYNTKKAIRIPNISIHKPVLDKSQWESPPYKQVYQNDQFKFDKPTLVVTNKYNREWGQDPINYFDHEALRWIFDTFQDQYQIVYIRFVSEMGYDDTVDSLDLQEFRYVLPDYPKVKTLQMIHDDIRANLCFHTCKDDPHSYNELQLKLFANCQKFITVQGGLAILASYFGGTNIIYAHHSPEFRIGSVYWYDEFGGSKIKTAQNYTDLKKSCIEYIRG